GHGGQQVHATVPLGDPRHDVPGEEREDRQHDDDDRRILDRRVPGPRAVVRGFVRQVVGLVVGAVTHGSTSSASARMVPAAGHRRRGGGPAGGTGKPPGTAPVSLAERAGTPLACGRCARGRCARGLRRTIRVVREAKGLCRRVGKDRRRRRTMRDSTRTMTGRVKERWGAARINSLDRQNMRLRDEISQLKTRLEDERSETEDLKDALRSSPKVVKVKKRSGFLRVVVIGGAAYVLGTRAGRERYDQLVDWSRSMRSKMERKADEVPSDVEDTA